MLAIADRVNQVEVGELFRDRFIGIVAEWGEIKRSWTKCGYAVAARMSE